MPSVYLISQSGLLGYLVSYWRFTEGASLATRYDSHGAHDLIRHGSVDIIADLAGDSATFSGSSQYLSIASNSDLQGGARDWTVAGWARRGASGAYQGIVSKGTQLSLDGEYFVGFSDTNALYAGWTLDGTDVDLINGPSTVLNTWYFWALSYRASDKLMRLHVNGVDYFSSLASDPYDGSADFLVGSLMGASSTPSLFLTGRIAELMVFHRYLSDEDLVWLYNSSLARVYPELQALQTTSRRITLEGDSITAGGEIAFDDRWPQVLQTILGPDVQVLNFGIGFKVIDGTDPEAQDNAVRVDSTFVDNAILVVWLGTNDIALDGDSGTTAYNDLVSYCQDRQAVGWRVIVVTMLPRTGTNTARATLNTNIRANYATFADGLADVAADSRIGDNGDNLDTTYFLADQIHLTAAGALIAEEIIRAAIAALGW